jgi:hypothetical protein
MPEPVAFPRPAAMQRRDDIEHELNGLRQCVQSMDALIKGRAADIGGGSSWITCAAISTRCTSCYSRRISRPHPVWSRLAALEAAFFRRRPPFAS